MWNKLSAKRRYMYSAPLPGAFFGFGFAGVVGVVAGVGFGDG